MEMVRVIWVLLELGPLMGCTSQTQGSIHVGTLPIYLNVFIYLYSFSGEIFVKPTIQISTPDSGSDTESTNRGI